MYRKVYPNGPDPHLRPESRLGDHVRVPALQMKVQMTPRGSVHSTGPRLTPFPS